MWMANTHVISALREKRARISAIIDRLQRQLDHHCADLTHIDGVLRLFEPEHEPGAIKPKRTYLRRTRYFRRNELSRLTLDVLRAVNGLMTTDEIASRVIEIKGFDAADMALRGSIRDQVLTVLRSLRKQETVEQIGLGRGVRWKLASEA
jgi:hypothetical protein